MSYIDWGYYSSHFPKLTEEEFDAALAGAEVKVEFIRISVHGQPPATNLNR